MARSDAERGIALPMVLAVLVCLLAVSIPFAMSMRHEQATATLRVYREDARREALFLQDLAAAHLADSAPTVDPTPWSDDAGELSLDLERVAEQFGYHDLGPNGRLWSADIEDLSGRIDLNTAPLHVIARGLGLSSTLARKLAPDDEELRVSNGDAFPTQGYLWIDGEITYFGGRDGGTLYDLQRPALVPGLWEPAVLDLEPREFSPGVEVVDFRAFLIATHVERAHPGRESLYGTVDEVRQVAEAGLGALTREQVRLLETNFTVHSQDNLRLRWVNAQRVFSAIVRGETRDLLVDDGRFIGPGSLVRVRNEDGDQGYRVVVRSDPRDGGYQLRLDRELDLDADASRAVVEVQYRRPVNVNSCSTELLALLLEGLPAPGSDLAIDAAVAQQIARSLVKARPHPDLSTIKEVLDQMVEKEGLNPRLVDVVYANAYNASLSTQYGTMPLCFASEGTYSIRTGASLNYLMSGREKSRSFMHEVISMPGAGKGVRAFGTQRDFEEPWQLTRHARGWTTFPENIDLYLPQERWSDPRSRIAAGRLFERFAAQDLADAGARLAPARLTGMHIGDGVTDVTIHMDQGEWAAEDVDGWKMDQGPPPPFPTGGGQGSSDRAAAANAMGNSDPSMISITGDNTAVEHLRPFCVSMWWNPGEGLTPGTLFECSRGVAENQIWLQFDGQALLLQVFDAARPIQQIGGEQQAGTVRYEFDDGLPLEADTWYHVMAWCRGNRTHQMGLMVDHRMRGDRFFYTRLTGGLGVGQPSTPGSLGGENLNVEDAESFPPRGVLRIGGELVEYTERSDSGFEIYRDANERFGGRAARGTDTLANDYLEHPAKTGVELYGYSGIVGSREVNSSQGNLADAIGPFAVAMVDPDVNPPEPIVVPTSFGDYELGKGYTSEATELPLVGLDRNPLPGDKLPFQANGGYALIITWDPRFAGTTITDPTTGQSSELLKTVDGEYLGGAEIVYYSRFDGSKMTIAQRGHSLSGSLLPPNLAKAPPEEGFTEPHAYVVTPLRLIGAPGYVPVLVMPIGLRINSLIDFPEPEPGDDADDPYTRAEMVQIDLDFADEDRSATEWVRYNSIVRDSIVRDDPENIRAVIQFLETRRTGDVGTNGGGDADYFDARIFQWAVNPPSGEQALQDIYDQINYEDLQNPNSNRLAFRGCLESTDSLHTSGAIVQPVYRVYRRFQSAVDYGEVRPGRFDEVTLVSGDGNTKDTAEINYGWTRGRAEDWGSRFAHLAFQAPPGDTFLRTELTGLDDEEPVELQVQANYADVAECRNFTRMIKFPSGELPTGAPDRLYIGQTADGGGQSTTAIFDEVRVVGDGYPEPTVIQASMALEEEILEQEEDQLDIAERVHWYPHMAYGSQLAEAIGTHHHLPDDAFVLQVGDELIACNQKIGGDPTARIADRGRGALGTEAAHHHRGDPINFLPWIVVSRLSQGIGAADADVRLQDAAGFPRSGFVQIDDEVIGYSFKRARGGPFGPGAGILAVPTYMTDQKGRVGEVGDAAFRGRFGTLPADHPPESVVYWLPQRYPDWYAERAEFPELGFLELRVDARRAWFHSLYWSEHSDDPTSNLVALLRIQGRGGFAGNPDDDPDLFFFDKPSDDGEPHYLGRQGDTAVLRFFTRYRTGALEPELMTANGWKRAPMLEVVGIDAVSDKVVEHHEESR